MTTTSTSTSPSISSTTITSKNDIFDTPITLVRPAPRVSAKEIEELQKQERLREEKDQREKEKARKEITIKMKKELVDENTKLYLDWDSLDPKDFNRLYKNNNNLKTMATSTTTNHNIDTSTPPTTNVFTTNGSPTNISTTKTTTGITTTTTTTTNNNNTITNTTNNNGSNSINKNKLNNIKLELNKFPINDNSSRGSSPSKFSKNLSPEEQIARFLNTPFQASPNSNQNQNKSQISPSNSINSIKSTECGLKTKSSFYGLSHSFSYSYQMDQDSMSRLQKVWNKMYQKFVEMIPNINLSYLPTRKNLIGYGQYSNVYLGLYSVNNDDDVKNGKHDIHQDDSEKSQDEDYYDDNHGYGHDTHHSNHYSTTHHNYFNNFNQHQHQNQHHDYDVSDDDSPLKSCAVKCFHKDYVSQMVAMTELNILTMLTNQPYIIQLIGIINEIEENKLIFQEEEKEKTKAKKDTNDSNLNNGLISPISNGLDSDSDSDSISEPIQVTIILEYASNGNILSWIKKNTEYVGKKLWIKWARQITHAVATFHNMLIIHHDIKPQNILLDDYLNAKIADFGSSCYAPDEFPGRDDLTIENCRFPMEIGLGRGTQAYCAPELFGSDDSYTFATDIYSLGVTLITMMTGNEPFKNARNNIHMIMCIRKGFFSSGAHDTELRFLNGEIAEPKIVDLLMQCVDLDPMKRPTASKILETLMEIDDYVPLE
jgi:serine/threonine protein kinase